VSPAAERICKALVLRTGNSARSILAVVVTNRLKIFVALPIDRLDRLAIERKADEIGGLRIGLKWVAISR